MKKFVNILLLGSLLVFPTASAASGESGYYPADPPQCVMEIVGYEPRMTIAGVRMVPIFERVCYK